MRVTSIMDDTDATLLYTRVQVEETAILVDGCIFEECYAGAKGGALVQDSGNLSVVSSTFYNNSAGSTRLPGMELTTNTYF